MACTAERASLINEFAIGKLSPQKTDELLDHVATCDECSATLEMVAGILTCQEKYGAEIFEGEPSFLTARWHRIQEALKGLNVTKAFVKIAVPVAAAAVAFLLFNPFTSPPERYAGLAQFRAPKYIPRSLRGPGVNEIKKTPFEEGMAAYTDGNFSKAVEKLSEVTEALPEFGEAYFYLGISYLMIEDEGRAIDALRKSAVLLKGYPFGEQSHWYLGMAYLKLGKGGHALEEFQKVIDLKGVYEAQAERMIEKIKEIGT